MQPESNDDKDRTKVAVCICTYKRPDVLAVLLARLVDVAAQVEASYEVGVVVIDDDPDGSAATVCGPMNRAFDGGLRYCSLGSGNISSARNQAIMVGSETASWLAFIDDDCLPDVEWLSELLAVQRRFDAECVSGFCLDRLPANTPRWLSDEPFLDPPVDLADGEVVDMGYLKNTLIAVDALTRHGLAFDAEFGGTGGEDAMFFYAAHAAGVKHRHARAAVVSEQVPPHRATFGYQLRRRYWYGTTESLTSVASDRASRSRMALSGGKKMMTGTLRPVVRAVRRETLQLRFALSEVLQGFGRIVGAAGFKVRHR